MLVFMGLGTDRCEAWGVDQRGTRGYMTVSSCKVVTSILLCFGLRLHPPRRIQIEDIEDEDGVAKQYSKAGMNAIPKDMRLLACES